MSYLRKCTLCCILQSHKPISLPHNESIIIGRSQLTGIKNASLSRNQLKLIANVKSCTVQVIPLGVNPSGVNGFSLKPQKEYTLHHKDRLELLLDQYIHEIIFDPAPDDQNSSLIANKDNSKRKSEHCDNEEHVKKQMKCDDSIKKETNGWEEIDKKLFIYTSEGVTSRNKIAGYDLDGTLITTKSGARFPKDAEDWKFAFAEVPKKLRELYKNDYKIIIFTNQAGIGLGKMKIADFKQKIEKIIEQINIPMQAFVSTGKGIYRKPAPGMWDALCERKNNDIEIDMQNSFYCGDAAGREKNWAPKMKKDHSVADRLFALNIEITFKTPEEHFLGARKIAGVMPEFDPRNINIVPLLIPEKSKLTSDKQEIIVFVGSPGSGKSYICKNLLATKGYIHINRDKLGSWQKCVSAAETALQKKQNVVIDNTNPDKESRKRYVTLAKKYGVACRCFVMNTSIHQAKHNNLFREITDSSHQVITDIIINSYKKNFVEPSSEEDFSEIVKVNCNPTFENPEHKRLYHMFLLDK